jgi:hypothetical protein
VKHPIPNSALSRMTDVNIHKMANKAVLSGAIGLQQWQKYFGFVHQRREARARMGFPRPPVDPEAG